MNTSAWRVFRTSPYSFRALIFNPGLRCQRSYTSFEKDKPVKFSESPASGWKASLTRQGVVNKDVSAWFQPYVVLASLSAFLLYFCVLREESDVDEMLSITLYNRIEGLEKVQLESCLKYNLENNLPTAAIEKRLYEIEQQEIKLFGKPQ